MTDLKPCPFCGEIPEIQPLTLTMVVIMCRNCANRGWRVNTGWYKGEEAAVEAWNKRIDQDGIKVAP